jgi:CHASE3 domain sensor protein
MADTSDEIFRTLRQVVHDDPALQARLFGLVDANEFIAAVQQLAQSQGRKLQEEEVRQAMRNGRKLWTDRKQP